MSSQPRSGGEDTNYDSTSATEGPNQHLHRRHLNNNNNTSNNIQQNQQQQYPRSSTTNRMPPPGSIAFQQLQQQMQQQQQNNSNLQASTSPGSGGGGGVFKISKRLAQQTPERRTARAQWQIAMWVPFVLLLLHKQNEIAAATNDIITVTHMMFVIVPGIAFGWFNEQRDGSRLPTYFSSTVTGFIWGIIRSDVLAPQVSAWAKVVSMLWFTYCAANLRLNWDIKRFSSSSAISGGGGGVTRKTNSPNQMFENGINNSGTAAFQQQQNQQQQLIGGTGVPIHLKLWNMLERNLGITFFFFIGEIVGFLAQPGGFMQVFDSALSFASFIVAPLFSTKISQWMLNTFGSWIATWSGARHGQGNTSAWNKIVLVLMIVMSLGVFFFFITWFWSSYLPWVMTQDQFVGALCMIVENMVFFQKKAEAKSTRKK